MNFSKWLMLLGSAISLATFEHFLGELEISRSIKPELVALLILSLGGRGATLYSVVGVVTIAFIRDAFLGLSLGTSILFGLPLLSFGRLTLHRLPSVLVGILTATLSLPISELLSSLIVGARLTLNLEWQTAVIILFTGLCAPVIIRWGDWLSGAKTQESVSSRFF